MDELKNIWVTKEGIFCHYYPDVHWEKPIVIPLSYVKINVYLYSSHIGYLGWMDKGVIWCKSFKYKRYEKSIALDVYI